MTGILDRFSFLIQQSISKLLFDCRECAVTSSKCLTVELQGREPASDANRNPSKLLNSF